MEIVHAQKLNFQDEYHVSRQYIWILQETARLGNKRCARPSNSKEIACDREKKLSTEATTVKIHETVPTISERPPRTRNRMCSRLERV